METIALLIAVAVGRRAGGVRQDHREGVHRGGCEDRHHPIMRRGDRDLTGTCDGSKHLYGPVH